MIVFPLLHFLITEIVADFITYGKGRARKYGVKGECYVPLTIHKNLSTCIEIVNFLHELRIYTWHLYG